MSEVRPQGPEATFLVWEGDPVEMILLAAAAEKCDLIVVGSHGRGRLGRLVLGSIPAASPRTIRTTLLSSRLDPLAADPMSVM